MGEPITTLARALALLTQHPLSGMVSAGLSGSDLVLVLGYVKYNIAFIPHLAGTD